MSNRDIDDSYEIQEKNINALEEVIDKKSVDMVVDLLDKYNLPSFCIDIAMYMAQRKRSGAIKDICKKHGIGDATFYRYRLHEGVIEIMKVLTKRIYARYIPAVMGVVKDRALQGNIDASKLFLGVNDMHQEEIPNNITNIQVNASDVDVFINDLKNKQI